MGFNLNSCLCILITCNLCASIKLDVFSTRTTYQWAHPSVVNREPEQNEWMNYTLGDEVCNAMHVYAVVRHGARYPSGNALDSMPILEQKLLTSKNKSQFYWLKVWQSRYNEDSKKNEGTLVQEGIDEQRELGTRFGKRFSNLFNSRNGHLTQFVSSYQSRALNSSRFFHTGLYGPMRTQDRFKVEINNTLTRFYDNCNNYINLVEKNTEHMEEFDKYSKTPEFQSMTRSIEERLGLQTNLTTNDVYLIYVWCSYELYIYGGDHWCGLLNDTEREILEYGKDIQKFYLKGYSHPIIQRMACPLVEDILTTMEKSKSDVFDYRTGTIDFSKTQYIPGKFVFGHETTTLPLLTVLGLYKDKQKLLASNREAMKTRQFRTSLTTPYTANIAIVMYACKRAKMDTQKQRFMVKVIVNEDDQVQIPACNKTACTYDEFVNYYSASADNCNLTKICGNKIGAIRPTSVASSPVYKHAWALWMYLLTLSHPILFFLRVDRGWILKT